MRLPSPLSRVIQVAVVLSLVSVELLGTPVAPSHSGCSLDAAGPVGTAPSCALANETRARPSTPWPGVTTPVLQEAGVLSLVNNSFLAPSAPVYNARDPDVLAIGGNGTRLWVAGSDSAVAEFNLTSLAFVRWFPVGGLPTGLVSDPTDNTLVVPLNGSSSALFLNASTGALVRNVTLPAPAAGGCYVAAAGEVYLASPTTNTVFGLYASNGTIRSVIPVGTAPVAVIPLNRTGEVAAIDLASANVTLVNEVTDRVAANISVRAHPVAAAFDFTNQLLYVLNAGTGLPGAASISVVSLVSAKVTANYSVPDVQGASGILFNPILGEVDVGALENNSSGVQDFLQRVNAANGSFLGSTPVGGSPGVLLYDAPSASMLIANRATNNVTVLSATGGVSGRSLVTGVAAWNLAPAAGSQQLFVLDNPGTTGSASRAFSVNVSTRSIVARIPVGDAPFAGAYDALDGSFYITNYASHTLTQVAVPSDLVSATYRISGPRGGAAFLQGIAWDSSADSLAMVNQCVGPQVDCSPLPGVQFFSPQFGGTIGSVNSSVSAPALGLVFDASHSLFDYANGPGDQIVGIDGASHGYRGNISLPGSPTSLALDSTNGLLYALVPSLGLLAGMEPSPPLRVANWSIPSGGNPTAVAYDPVIDRLVVTYASGWLLVLAPNNGTITENITIPGQPGSVVYDPDSNAVYVADGERGAVIEFSTGSIVRYLVTFNETGLPPSTSWSVVVGGLNLTSSQSSQSANLANGSYVFTVGTTGAYVPAPSSGSVVVAGGPVARTINFSLQSTNFTVTFDESGLPIGTTWSMTLGGFFARSTTSTIVFSEPNGSYGFVIANVPTFATVPGTGTVVVLGQAVVKNISFVPYAAYHFAVQFVGSGLAPGAGWSVSINGSIYSSTSSTVSLSLPNGSYPFTVTAPTGYRPTPSFGTASVQGGPVSIPIGFSALNASGPPPPPMIFGVSLTIFFVLVGVIAAVAVGVVGALWQARKPPPLRPVDPLLEAQVYRGELPRLPPAEPQEADFR